jgi:hypothetical protein
MHGTRREASTPTRTPSERPAPASLVRPRPVGRRGDQSGGPGGAEEQQELGAARTDVDRDSPHPGSALHLEQRVQPADVHEGRSRQVDRQVRIKGVASQALGEESDQHRSREPVELPGDVQHRPAATRPVQMQAEKVGLPAARPRMVIPSRPVRDQRGAEGTVRGSAGPGRRTRARFISANAHAESTICVVVLRWTAMSCSTERR